VIVIFTGAAETNLEEMGDHIARNNPARARTFVREFEECFFALARVPHASALLQGHEHAGIRRQPHGNYLIRYRVVQDRIEILRIVTGARDDEALLFSEE